MIPMIRVLILVVLVGIVLTTPCKQPLIGERCNSTIGSGFCVLAGICVPQGVSNFTPTLDYNCSNDEQICCVIPDEQLPGRGNPCTPFGQDDGVCVNILKDSCNKKTFI